MLTKNCISITELRNNATKLIGETSQSQKFIFVHNKPRAVLMDIKKYERIEELEKLLPYFDNLINLSQNKSFDFLKTEPNLYENY